MSPAPGAATAGGLLGRELPLATIAATLADVRAGQRRVVLVEGDAGMGKTSLLRVALAHEKAHVLWASGDEGERDVDHGIIEQLVRSAPPDPHRPTVPLSGDPLRTGAVLVELVDRLHLDGDRPLVVVVDDVQWADAASIRALTFAARRLQQDPVALLVASRPDGVAQLPSGLLRLVEHDGARLRLEGLPIHHVRAMAELWKQGPVSSAAASRLLEHTEGSPLHLRTLLEELPPDALEAAGELPSPRSYSTLVLGRLAACSPEVEALVVAVAVLGESTALHHAAAVAEVDDALVLADRAVAEGLLRFATVEGSSVQVAPSHPLVRAAVLGDLPVARRAIIHQRAARVLGGEAALRHRLMGAAAPDPELWQEAMQEVTAASVRGEHGAAAGLARRASAVAVDDEHRARSLFEAVDQLLLAGRLDDARRLATTIPDGGPSAFGDYVTGRLAYVIGPRVDGVRLLRRAWRSLVGAPEDVDLCGEAAGPTALIDRTGEGRRLASRVAASLATAAVDRANGEAAIVWAGRSLELDAAEAALESAGHMLAGAYALTGRFAQGLAAFDELCRRAATATARADAHCGRGMLRLWSHDLAGAASDLETSLEALGSGGSFVARESARFYLADVRYRQGRWDEAIGLAQLVASIVDDSDQQWMVPLVHATLARPLAARGAVEAAGHVDQARSAAAEVGVGVGALLAEVSALELAVCRGDVELAVALGEQLHSVAGDVPDEIAPWRANFVEALVARDEVERAGEVARWMAAHACTPLVANDAALTAVLQCDPDDEVLEAGAMALDADLVGPYPRARLELAAGRRWRRRGERRRAQAALERARARFEALGATPWIERVDREITALGLRPSRRAAQPGAELTPQERTIAHLVAQGRTNREVASELVVSAKTVEHHLSRVYAKLGVRSRTELAHLLRPEP